MWCPGLHNCWPRGEAPVFARFGGEVYHFIAQWSLGHHSCGSGIFHCDSSQWNHEWWSLVGWSWNFQSLVGWPPNKNGIFPRWGEEFEKEMKGFLKAGGSQKPKYLQVEMFKAEFHRVSSPVGADVGVVPLPPPTRAAMESMWCSTACNLGGRDVCVLFSTTRW